MPHELLVSILRGFLMGSADIVPGVSGGTIALVLGIYERLVASISRGSTALGRLLRGDRRGFVAELRRVEWTLVLPLVIGIGLAVVTLTRLLETALARHPEAMAGFFLGLVGGSVVLAWRLLRRRGGFRLAVVAGTSLVVFVALGLIGGEAPPLAGRPSLPAFFLAGAIAISAMILPGISGSFLLVVLGMYGPVVAAVNARDLPALGVFLVGTVVGLALFSRGLDWALRRHHDTVLAALIGLMAGSLRVLWPWPDGVDSTSIGPPDGKILVVAGLAIVGVAAVLAISALAGVEPARSGTVLRVDADVPTLAGNEEAEEDR